MGFNFYHLTRLTRQRYSKN